MAELQAGEPECPVCWNPFNNTFHTPKVLDCCHSFCVECLAHLRLVTPAQHGLPCPICRQPTVLASGRPVTDLPTDTAMLTLLCLEPLPITLEGHQLCLKAQPESRCFLRQLQVCTLDIDREPGSQTEGPQAVAPATTTRGSHGIPTFRTLRQCVQDPGLPILAYLMLAIFGAALLSLFFISWAKKFLWNVG
uniref:Ring finger protein 183 n=2 Tax=Pipistrellus kuhlii TaxID=59472 RepID=A0A7J7W4C6_PIPKU|nr:ring finger protein 183 [Pipistrellus kuhlii]